VKSSIILLAAPIKEAQKGQNDVQNGAHKKKTFLINMMKTIVIALAFGAASAQIVAPRVPKAHGTIIHGGTKYLVH